MKKRVAVVGAGISGLIFARELSKFSDVQLHIFEKANRPGGRSCSREIQPGAYVDLGAQFFTVRSLFMESLLAPYILSGLVEKWSPRLMFWSSQDNSPHLRKDNNERYVASPSMGHLALALSQDLPIKYRSEISSVGTGSKNKWSLVDTNNQILGEFDYVVFTLPPPQTERLFRVLPMVANQHEYQKMSPCFAVGIELENKLDILPNCDAICFEDHPIFSWIIKDSSKPSRDQTTQKWVIHASARWSEENIDFDREESGINLLHLFEEIVLKTKLDLSSIKLFTHRWRYAKPVQVDRCKFRFYEDLGLAFCGDSFGGPRFEGAVLSGASLAHQFLRVFDMNK